ncbi:MAG: hypothetical protein JEZ04_07775 [Spirochaetales bacterium]|nr:hypothetical protein [Spirochaetales bacterium]
MSKTGINIALDGGDLFSLISTAEQSEFKIDLIDITDAHDPFAENIRKSGTLLV